MLAVIKRGGWFWFVWVAGRGGGGLGGGGVGVVGSVIHHQGRGDSAGSFGVRVARLRCSRAGGGACLSGGLVQYFMAYILCSVFFYTFVWGGQTLSAV